MIMDSGGPAADCGTSAAPEPMIIDGRVHAGRARALKAAAGDGT